MHNEASQFGGAIFIYYSGNISIQNCLFQNNTASSGGALYYEDSLTGLFCSLIIN